jgi:hypothetical protein
MRKRKQVGGSKKNRIDRIAKRRAERWTARKIWVMAEGEGFEPPVPFQVQRFSRPPVSTAHTSLRVSLE